MTKIQKNVVTVLNRLAKSVESGEVDARSVAVSLDDCLNDLMGDDCFGTEGQCDPRGDFRDGEWAMHKIQK